MNGDPVQLMVLQAPGTTALQVYLEDGGIWRETLPSGVSPTTQSYKELIESHLDQLMTQVGEVPPVPMPANQAGFRNRFTAWYQNLLPPEVRESLSAAAGTAAAGVPLLKIFVHQSVEWVPWELLHDGTGFLGLRFAICRLPIVKQRTEVRGPKERQVNSVFSLLGRNILTDGVFATWENTFQPYRKTAAWEQRFPAGGAGDYPTLDQLDQAKQADILHVTCHGGWRDTDTKDLCWTLDHQNRQTYNYRIAADTAENARFTHRPLVFGNACASNATQAGDRGALHGFGASFMIGGALNFVGTLAPITRETGVAFAARFYENLFGNGGKPGLPVAEALRVTKQSFFDAAYPDPSYLFYCLYGPPDTIYQPG